MIAQRSGFSALPSSSPRGHLQHLLESREVVDSKCGGGGRGAGETRRKIRVTTERETSQNSKSTRRPPAHQARAPMRPRMSAWFPLPLLLLACWGAPRGAEAYAEGAPTQTCSSMTPGHGAAVGSLAYSIDVSGTTFTNTSSLTVTVKGTYQGVIMQARAPGSTTPVGTWATPPSNTKLMTCSSASDTMTHSSETVKINSIYTWTSPKCAAPASVEFVATVAQDKNAWIKIKSTTVTAQGYSTCRAGPGSTFRSPASIAWTLPLGIIVFMIARV
ncbi:putative ferric-chelate reductase 1 isoform X1 [Petromyzon marinus]|uniref:putative ferric-chelate reductase 1 isoform X1 n=2 Tax=Petromyzon marinus TaxID=7757 RepID=UPI003F6E8427